MIRQTSDRIDPKRRNVISYRKRQFADATYKQQEYPHRLNFYDVAPTAEIKLEEFEQWAIDRLRGTSCYPPPRPALRASPLRPHPPTLYLPLPCPLPRPTCPSTSPFSLRSYRNTCENSNHHGPPACLC